MGVAGSLVAGVLKVLLLDVRRPKDGKLKGIFFLVFLFVGSATPSACFGVYAMGGAPRDRLAGSVRHEGDWKKCLCCVHLDKG